MTTKTMTWQQAYDVIEVRPLDTLVRLSPKSQGRNCVIAVLAQHLGLDLRGPLLSPVSTALGYVDTLGPISALMGVFDGAVDVASGKVAALAYIQEQIDGGE